MSANDVASPLAAQVQAAAPSPAQVQTVAAPTPRPSPPPKTEETPAQTVEPPFPEHRVLLKIDEATQTIQAQIRDLDSGKVVYALPDDQWLRLSAKLRAFAATAIVDKSV
ncbi:hypothetical protein [Desulfovibrio sp. TomC]|uniref:hypothetical protein n=1 Tax=Desulfovibrio sp. TomC TaxID=1562888 RepID=UPI000574BD42|nr:hypothetical protein [Desulfovibrio sp. TomC]KHK01937.1 hypothetical protein NY78_2756 [Desulfovibrio sp. TomC]